MNAEQLLAMLAEDPFNDRLRSDLANHYHRMGLWEKAHKQLMLVKKQRPLSDFETDLLVDCLRQFGFDEEADAIEAANGQVTGQSQSTSSSVPVIGRSSHSWPTGQPVAGNSSNVVAHNFRKAEPFVQAENEAIAEFETKGESETKVGFGAEVPSQARGDSGAAVGPDGPVIAHPSTVNPPHKPAQVDSSSADARVLPIGAAASRKIRFSDIGGLADVKKTIRMQIVEPFVNPGMFAKFGKKAGGGVLLYGPPGCGKTMIARAIAGECNAEFISVSISDVLSSYHGQSERNLCEIFEKARAHKPCVLFFDELDALAYARSKSTMDMTRTLVNEFLNQLDGIGNDNENVLMLAATNLPWDIDTAMKRPGRFSRMIFVPPPDDEAKLRILQIKLHNLPVEPFDLGAIVEKMGLFSGADIDGVIEKTKERVIEEIMDTGRERKLSQLDFERALSVTQPSTEDWLRTAKNLVKYSGADRSYQAVEMYLKKARLL